MALPVVVPMCRLRSKLFLLNDQYSLCWFVEPDLIFGNALKNDI